MLLQPSKNEKLISESVKVSIPQAVGVVATKPGDKIAVPIYRRVSIPQAVGVVATAGLTEPVFMGLKNRFWKTSYRKRSNAVPFDPQGLWI